LLLGAIGHFIRNDPTSILAVLPTDDDSRNFIVSQIETDVRRLPELRGAIPITRTGAYNNFDT